jgi:hypothetical protein
MLKGSRFFGTPISFSTDGGGGDHVAAEDRLSPHEWTDIQWVRWVQAFNERKAAGPAHVRYLTLPPEELKTPGNGSQRW